MLSGKLPSGFAWLRSLSDLFADGKQAGDETDALSSRHHQYEPVARTPGPVDDQGDSGQEAFLQQTAESIAGGLPPLLLAAERVANSVAQGVHGRRRIGQGDAFWQYRSYESGDSVQSIDWRQSGRSDQRFVRQNEWEAAQTVWLSLDDSGSMAWKSRESLPEKRERAIVLLLALSMLLGRGGEYCALAGGDSRPATGRLALERIAQQILAPAAGQKARKPEMSGLPLSAAARLPRHSTFVWFTDLLAPEDEILNSLRDLVEAGQEGCVVQILDPAEESFPFDGRVLFQGCEGEADQLLSSAASVRDDYQARLLARREKISDYLVRSGWHFLVHHTDRPPQEVLLCLHMALADLPDAGKQDQAVRGGQA